MAEDVAKRIVDMALHSSDGASPLSLYVQNKYSSLPSLRVSAERCGGCVRYVFNLLRKSREVRFDNLDSASEFLLGASDSRDPGFILEVEQGDDHTLVGTVDALRMSFHALKKWGVYSEGYWEVYDRCLKEMRNVLIMIANAT